MNFHFPGTPSPYSHKKIRLLSCYRYVPRSAARPYKVLSANGRSTARRLSSLFSNLLYQHSPVSPTSGSRVPLRDLPFLNSGQPGMLPVMKFSLNATRHRQIRSHFEHPLPHAGTNSATNPSKSHDAKRVSKSHVSNSDDLKSGVSKEAMSVPGKKRARIPPPPKAPKCPLVADFGPLDVLFEDDVILVLNKHAGIKHEPLHRFAGGSLVNRVVGYLGKEPFTMHRLDMYTSGVLLFAKERHVVPHLTAQFRSGQMEKKYLVMVLGLPEKDFVVSAPIGRDPNHKFARTVLWDGGQHAVTRFRVLRSNAQNGVSVLEAVLDTGRTHQIRVHLQHVGLPVMGDEIYGALPLMWDGVYGPIPSPTSRSDFAIAGGYVRPSLSSIQQRDVGSIVDNRVGDMDDPVDREGVGRGRDTCLVSSHSEGAIQRQALHARSLTLTHPITNERRQFVAPIAHDIRAAMAACGMEIEYPIYSPP